MDKTHSWITAIKRVAPGLILLGIVAAILLFVAQPEPTPTTASLDQTPDQTPILATKPRSPATARPTVTPPPPSPLATPTPTPTATPFPQPTATLSPQPDQPGRIPTYTYTIINTYPHDRTAFTQGLIFSDGILYEGTGLRGESTLRKVVLETGGVLQGYRLPDQFFGEGITIFEDRIIQLTWQSHLGFVYDKESFALQQEFTYPTEGWGLTHDGRQLIMSDGTANLYFLDPATFLEVGRVEVHDQNGPLPWLNELEYIRGEVYANVWRTTRIARIDPQTGQVTGWIDLPNLLGPEDLTERVDVMNGIAYDAEGDRLFVTGKWWPKLFEIELVPHLPGD